MLEESAYAVFVKVGQEFFPKDARPINMDELRAAHAIEPSESELSSLGRGLHNLAQKFGAYLRRSDR